MQSKSDAQLLREYADHGAEAAFTELVHRHTNLVYSAALRQVESPDAAAEVAQRVFVGLATGVQSLLPRLRADASLAGWLCRAARNLSLNHRRDDFRRQSRERQAMEQFISSPDAASDWEHLRPVLDAAMSELDESDYDALVLRYFQGRDFRSVGAAIGVSDDTAQKRVARALEKLRDLLSRQGIRTAAVPLAVVITAHAVQAAPVGLAATISAAALAGTALTASATATLTATKAIAMTTLQKTLVTATVAILAGAGVYEARHAATLRGQVRTLQQHQAALDEENRQMQSERDYATNQLAALRDENDRLSRNTAELIRLRGLAGVARRATVEAEQLRAQLARQPGNSGNPVVTGAMADAMQQSMTQQVEGRLARMAASLRLTPAQIEAAREILTRQSQAMSAGMKQAFSGKFDKDELVRLAREAGNPEAQIKALLTPEQQAAYQNYQQEEAAYNARLAVNAEMLQLQAMDLTPGQKDQAFAALYEVTFNQLTGTAKPPATNQAGAMLWALDQKTKSLESVLTPEQFKSYTQQQALQAKLIQDITDKMESGGSK